MRYWSLSQPQLHSQVEDDWWLRNIPKIQLIMGSSTRELVTKRGNQLEINETGKDNKAKSTRFIVLMLPNAVQTWLSCEEILRTVTLHILYSSLSKETLTWKELPSLNTSPTCKKTFDHIFFLQRILVFLLIFAFHPQRLHARTLTR